MNRLQHSSNMFFRTVVFTALALAVAATGCPNCPSTDLAGNILIAQSGGTLGTPRFCGYGTVVGGNILDECFYSDGTGAGSGPGANCPATAPIKDVC
ncbi:hypothetical protein C8R45DRAFT_1044036 [Mycena sanguinolenta]|nr:hypothetical protein C8R45DRAFT_1044036 [Mycena sanguinolenta]